MEIRPFLPCPPFVRVIAMKIGLPPRRMSPDESVIAALSPHMLNGRRDGCCVRLSCVLPVQVSALFGLFCAQEVAEEQEQIESSLHGQTYKLAM